MAAQVRRSAQLSRYEIRRDRTTGRWTVTTPGFGFAGAVQSRVFADQPSALRWVDARIQRKSIAACPAERAGSTPGMEVFATSGTDRRRWW
jgi:hypothetical protein